MDKFITHLRKRGVETYESSLICNSICTETTHLICDLCHMIVAAEDELINVEKQFANTLKIPKNRIL